jgi:hypothetical protein
VTAHTHAWKKRYSVMNPDTGLRYRGWNCRCGEWKSLATDREKGRRGGERREVA